MYWIEELFLYLIIEEVQSTVIANTIFPLWVNAGSMPPVQENFIRNK